MTPSTELHKQMKTQALVWTEADQKKLLAVPGEPGLWMGDEAKFLAETGCPPEELEEWLENEWIPYDLRAVLSGAEVIGPYPHLLTRQTENQTTARLFCCSKALVLSDYRSHSVAPLTATIAARPWPEAAAEITSQIDQLTAACAARELAVTEVELVWNALWISVQQLAKLPAERCDVAEMKRLQGSMAKFHESYTQRGADQTPRAKYAEAQVDSRRALGVNHNPALDGFRELVEFARQVSSAGIATYVLEEMREIPDKYLDAMEMMARDHADPFSVTNPPARVIAALSRKQLRAAELERRRWSPLLPDRLRDGRNLEVDLNAELDWERAKIDVGLPPDHVQVVEAKMDGLDLHSSAREKGQEYDPRRAESVRRSLEADRPWAKKLRRRLSAYGRRRRVI